MANLFVAKYAGSLRFSEDEALWYAWDGLIWRKSGPRVALQAARELVHRLSAGEQASVRLSTERAGFFRAVVQIAQGDPLITATSKHWDSDHWLLGTPAGTVDLKTGVLHPANASDRISKSTSVAPAKTSDCPHWKTFLREACEGDIEIIRFLQQWLGYCLTGVTREHALVSIYGVGGSGKGTFLNTAFKIVGDYAANAASDTFTASRFSKNTDDLAKMCGARFVTSSETEQGQALDERLIKTVTGGDPITARRLYARNFTFDPQFKLTIIGNHRPVLTCPDRAMRRRTNIVAFNHKPETPDHKLSEKLQSEWPAILRWMIEGCLDWQENGLQIASIVMDGTDSYFEDQDTVGQWLKENYDCQPGNERWMVSAADIFASWGSFAEARNEPVGSMKALSAVLQQKRFISKRTTAGQRYLGLRLRTAGAGLDGTDNVVNMAAAKARAST